MKKILFALSISCFPITGIVAQGGPHNPFVNVEIAQYPVIVNPGAYVANQLLIMLDTDASISEVEVQFASNRFPISASRNTSGSMRIWTLTFAEGTNIESALEFAKSLSEVQIAQFNHYVARRVNIPNDAEFGLLQWNMNNTGQFGGIPDADIDAPEAWDITTGGLTVQGDTIVVAVIDAGFDLNHPDLNFKKNYGEIPNNSIDDDNNGYVDDFNGWNAYNSSGNITSDNHGTHVAGIVGARGNNTIGVAGVNWGVKILPILGSDGTEAQVVEAYTYVFDSRKLYNNTNGAEGAFVVSTNSSFGVDLGQPSQYPLWCAMYDSMGVVGVLSAAATANQNWNIDVVGDIPTSCASMFMLGVTNTDRTDVKYSNAGFGTNTIDIGAPGTQVESTIPGNGYTSMTGTSMASPHIAGAVALMYAAGCSQLITDYKSTPDSIALVMRTFLLSSVDPNASLNGICTSNGRFNLYNALLAVQTYNCTPSSNSIESNAPLSFNTIFPNPAKDLVRVNFNSDLDGFTLIRIVDMLGQTVSTFTTVSSIGNNTVVLDLNSIALGMYSIQIQIGSNSAAVKKIIIE